MMQATSIDWGVIAPLTVLVATGLIVLLADLASNNAPRKLLYGIGAIGTVAAFLVSLPLAGSTVSTFGGSYASDAFSWPFDALLMLTLAMTFLLSSLRKAEDGGNPGAYAALLIFCTIGGAIMAGATDLIGIFIGLEVLSLALYALAGTGYPRRASAEAALKYVLLGSFASGFLIFGMALLYGAGGSIALATIAHAAAGGGPLFIAGFALFLVGIAFKIALAPFHIWTPDVYEGSPLAITAFMAVAVKAAAFAVLARFAYVVFGHDAQALVPLWAIAVLSMIVGNVGAIRQTNLKRLLAFSGIAQAGYLILALAGVGRNGVATLVFYLAAYAFMNLGAFAVVALIGDGDERHADLAAYRGLFFRRPVPAALMMLFFLSLAGIPATAGFIGKVLLLGQAFGTGPWGVAMAIALIAGTIVSFYVYFKVIWQMFAPVDADIVESNGNALGSWIAVGVGAAGVLLLGIVPQILLARL
jgi:NADH-quinone oxidoreductase subunit N